MSDVPVLCWRADFRTGQKAPEKSTEQRHSHFDQVSQSTSRIEICIKSNAMKIEINKQARLF